MTDDLLTRMRSCVTLSSAYKLLDEAAGEIERLTAAHRLVVDNLAERNAECERLRALLLKSYCYVAAHMPIGVKTDNDRKVLMLDIDAALAGEKT